MELTIPAVFSLTNYLYTVTTYDSFTVRLTAYYNVLTLITHLQQWHCYICHCASPGAIIIVQSATVGAYWQYVNTLDSNYYPITVDPNAQLGHSLTVNTVGTQILAGAPYDSAVDANGDTIANAGAVYAFDRSVVKYIITDADPADLCYSRRLR
jgi:hypothetical protein